MKEHTRNLAVGLTVIVGLVILGVMILIFAGVPGAFRGGYDIRLAFPATADAQTGDPVHLVGVPVGTITDVGFADDDPRKGVVFTVRIDSGVRIPGNVEAFIYARGFTGGAYVELKPGATERIDPATGKVLEFLPTDYDKPIHGQLQTGLIPEELKDALAGIGRLADNLNALLTAPAETPSRPATAPGTTTAQAPTSAPASASLRTTMLRLNATLDGLEKFFGSVENQNNLKVSLANLASATQRATEAMDALKIFAAEASATIKEGRKTIKDISETVIDTRANVDQLARKLIEDAEKISTLMTTINNMAVKFGSGQGTTGKLINDPELYNSLLDASKQLNDLLKEFRQLVQVWKEQGVGVKVK